MIELDRIYNEDCRETMKRVETNSVDFIVTDPPFSFAGSISNGRASQSTAQFFAFWWRAVAQELARILKPAGEGFIWCDWKTAPSIEAGFPLDQDTNVCRISQMLYRYREMPGMGRPFRSSVDMIAYLRGPESTGARIPNTTRNWISQYWYYGKHKFHPAEKSVDMVQQLIQWCSDEKAIGYDPFCGFGTFGVACQRTGRRWFGSEINSEYFAVAQKRIEAERAQMKLVL